MRTPNTEELLAFLEDKAFYTEYEAVTTALRILPEPFREETFIHVLSQQTQWHPSYCSELMQDLLAEGKIRQSAQLFYEGNLPPPEES